MQAAEAWYALASAQLNAAAAMRLLEVFQQPEAIFAATPREWTARAKLSASGCARLVDAANRDLSAELARLERTGIQLIAFYDDAYPTRLRAIPDPPPTLFIHGTLSSADERAIAIVGSRRASPYGRQVAAELAVGLAQRGITIVSGLALGADAAAHEGALRAGGRTLAVLGGGVDVIYPPEHAALYARVAASGAVISEAPPGSPPVKMSFPIRNRIISGLSLGVVVVEAPEKSGALITARHALDQGREVFAVPGSVNSVQSRGSHQLLRDGARLVESVDDILEELNWHIPAKPSAPPTGPSWDLDTPTASNSPTPMHKTISAVSARPAATPSPSVAPSPAAPLPSLPPEEEQLLRLLTTTAKHIDVLIEESDLSPAQINAGLLMLELKGYVQRRPGNQYIRIQ